MQKGLFDAIKENPNFQPLHLNFALYIVWEKDT